MRFPVSSTGVLPLSSTCSGSRRGPFPNPLDRRPAQHGDRSRGRDHLRRAAGRPAAALPGGGATAWREALEEGAQLQRDPGGDPQPRRRRGSRRSGTALVPLWDDRTFYDFVATAAAFAQPLVPPPRGVRPGRLRHRRLGFRLSQLDAGDPARRDDQLRRGPAADRGRRRAGAARACGAPRRRAWRTGRPGTTLATLHGGATAAAAWRGSPARADGRFAVTDRWGAHARLRRRARHLPDLAADHRHRHARSACSRTSCGWRWTAPATCSRPRPS